MAVWPLASARRGAALETSMYAQTEGSEGAVRLSLSSRRYEQRFVLTLSSELELGQSGGLITSTFSQMPSLLAIAIWVVLHAGASSDRITLPAQCLENSSALPVHRIVIAMVCTIRPCRRRGKKAGHLQGLLETDSVEPQADRYASHLSQTRSYFTGSPCQPLIRFSQ